jgi:hypothetical protein
MHHKVLHIPKEYYGRKKSKVSLAFYIMREEDPYQLADAPPTGRGLLHA